MRSAISAANALCDNAISVSRASTRLRSRIMMSRLMPPAATCVSADEVFRKLGRVRPIVGPDPCRLTLFQRLVLGLRAVSAHPGESPIGDLALVLGEEGA